MIKSVPAGLTVGLTLAVVTVGLFACRGEEEDASGVATPGASQAPSPSDTAETTPTATAIPLATATASPTTKYKNPVYGYSLEYPSEWFIHTDPGGYLTITSYDPLTAKGVGGFPPDTFKIDIAVLENPKNLSLSEWIAESDKASAEYEEFTIVTQSEVTAPSVGITRTIAVGGVQVREHVFRSGSRCITCQGVRRIPRRRAPLIPL